MMTKQVIIVAIVGLVALVQVSLAGDMSAEGSNPENSANAPVISAQDYDQMLAEADGKFEQLSPVEQEKVIDEIASMPGNKLNRKQIKEHWLGFGRAAGEGTKNFVRHVGPHVGLLKNDLVEGFNSLKQDERVVKLGEKVKPGVDTIKKIGSNTYEKASQGLNRIRSHIANRNSGQAKEPKIKGGKNPVQMEPLEPITENVDGTSNTVEESQAHN